MLSYENQEIDISIIKTDPQITKLLIISCFVKNINLLCERFPSLTELKLNNISINNNSIQIESELIKNISIKNNNNLVNKEICITCKNIVKYKGPLNFIKDCNLDFLHLIKNDSQDIHYLDNQNSTWNNLIYQSNILRLNDWYKHIVSLYCDTLEIKIKTLNKAIFLKYLYVDKIKIKYDERNYSFNDKILKIVCNYINNISSFISCREIIILGRIRCWNCLKKFKNMKSSLKKLYIGMDEAAFNKEIENSLFNDNMYNVKIIFLKQTFNILKFYKSDIKEINNQAMIEKYNKLKFHQDALVV